jgi:arsenical pump membrane protein
MISRLILAGIAVAAVALWPRSPRSAAVALAAGGLSALLAGAGVARDALVATAPMLAFLTAALGLAALAERRGLAERAASGLAAAAAGRTVRLYGLVCATSALLTCVVSLDGAVVLMVPVVRSLVRRCGVAFAPFFLGSVVVANAASLAVPEGNPTNLVVMSRLGLSPEAFLGHLLLPGLCAAALCALVPLRRLGSARYVARVREREPSSQPVLLVPWRVAAQMAGLLATLDGLAPALPMRGAGLGALLAVAGCTAGAAALANNLPVSASVAALASAGPGAYAALIGLSVGALATPHGSVATLIARDLAGDEAEARWSRVWAPIAAAAVTCATLLLWVNP